MADDGNVIEVADAIRKSENAKGRAYAGTGVEPQWLASEILGYCKTQGWEVSLASVPNAPAWLVVTDNVVALVEGDGDQFSVKVDDLNPVHLKTLLAGSGLLALTGAGVVALPFAWIAAWRSHYRKGKVSSIIEFVDSRVAPQSARPTPSPSGASVADRLRELAALRDQGLITTDEFENKKQDLLKAL